MVSDRIMAPGSVFTNKQISILKSAKSLGIIRKTEFGKTKGNEHKLVNGFQNSKIIVKSSTMSKAQESTSTGFLQKSVSNGVSVSSASPQSIKVIQATKANDLASLSNLIAKKMTKNHILEQVKTYICKYCCRKFPNSCLLEIHYKSHGPNPRHACHLCGISASNFSSLMCHFVKHSKGKTASTYRIKQEKVPVIEAFKKKIVHKPETSISCTRCKRSFSTKEIFNVHYCPALNKKSEYVCTYCRKVTTTVEEYRDHIQSHSVSPYVCTACNIQFPKKTQLSAHIAICPKKKQNAKRNLVQSPTKGKKKIKIVTASQPEKQEKPKKSPKKEILKATEVKSDDSLIHASDQKTSSLETEENSAVLNSHPPLNQSSLDSTMQNNPSTSFQDQPEMSSPKPAKKRRRRRRRTTVEMLNVESEPAHERPTRNLRSPSRYIADQNSAYTPTRRSARLVNRKRITFSDDEDETSDPEVLIEIPAEQDTQKESSKPAEETNVKIEPPEVNVEEECLDVVIKEEPVMAMKIVKTKAMRRKRIRKSQNKTSTLYCQVCSLLFRSMGSLRRHRKMHTGKPQFVCQFCGKFFFRRDIHLRHENSVHQNSADRGFHCYYCKQNFASSAPLMEHSTATHVTKALVPERIRRCTRVITCTGISKSPKDKKPVASFLLTDVKKEALEVSQATLPSIYDSEAFSTPKPPGVEQNIQEHSDTKYPVHTPDSQECIDIKPTPSQLSKCLLQNEVLNCHDKTSRETTVPVDTMRLQQKDTRETVPPNTCQEVVHSNSNKLNSSVTQFDSCKLCSKELTEGQHSICSPHVTHKIVDWYQCMVCPYSGTQSQVQEHMVTHIYKIGTLVVSEEDVDYNGVRTFLPLFSDAIDVPQPENDERSRLQNNDEERNILQQTCGDDDAQRDVRDCNSPYTLMEEVMCSRCGDVIIDLEVLTLHPCSETDTGTFTCFVGICRYSTTIKSNIQKHLAERHFVALFSDVLFGPTCQRKTPEKKCEENALPLKRYTQHIEDVFIGPSLES